MFALMIFLLLDEYVLDSEVVAGEHNDWGSSPATSAAEITETKYSLVSECGECGLVPV